MRVILYTTHCPKCSVLEKKLNSKNIQYEENTDTELMISKGFNEVPILEVDGNEMNFKTANEWLNQQ